MNRIGTQKVRRAICGGRVDLGLENCRNLLSRIESGYCYLSIAIHRIETFRIKVQKPLTTVLSGAFLLPARDQLCYVKCDSLFAVARFYCGVCISHSDTQCNGGLRPFNRTLFQFLHRPSPGCSHAAAPGLSAFSAFRPFHFIQTHMRNAPHRMDAVSFRIHLAISHMISICRCAGVNAACTKVIPALTPYLYRAFACSLFTHKRERCGLGIRPKAVKRQRPSKTPMNPIIYRRFKSSPSRP
jgi:hypothetical protein